MNQSIRRINEEIEKLKILQKRVDGCVDNPPYKVQCISNQLYELYLQKAIMLQEVSKKKCRFFNFLRGLFKNHDQLKKQDNVISVSNINITSYNVSDLEALMRLTIKSFYKDFIYNLRQIKQKKSSLIMKLLTEEDCHTKLSLLVSHYYHLFNNMYNEVQNSPVLSDLAKLNCLKILSHYLEKLNKYRILYDVAVS